MYNKTLVEFDEFFIGYKIKIYPTKSQIDIFENYFDACRKVYNLCIVIEESYYKEAIKNNNEYTFLSFISLRNIINDLKKTDKYKWINDYNSDTIASVVKDVINAYTRFFNKVSSRPKFKTVRNYHKQFPIRSDRMSITDNKVRISSIGYVSCKKHDFPEIIGNSNKNATLQEYIHYNNPRVIFDGCSYYLAFTIRKNESHYIKSNDKFINNEIWNNKEYTDAVGIDLGCKKDNWIKDSNGTSLKMPDTSKEEKKIKLLQQKLDIKRRHNENKMKEKGIPLENYKYSNNEKKILAKINEYENRISNKKKNAIHNYSNNLIESKPECVILEDIRISDMYLDKTENAIHRKNHNRMVRDAELYTVQNIITYKCINNGIPVYKADKEYPSTQLCSICGYRQDIGRSRIYKCPCCGIEIDRDYNAANNLAKLNSNDAITLIYTI